MLEKKWYAGGWHKEWIDKLVVGIIAILFVGNCVSLKWHKMLEGYVPLITFLTLVFLFLNHINWVQKIKAKDMLLVCMLMGMVIELINIRLSHSGYGVILNIACLLLMLYLSDKVEFSKKCYYFIAIICLIGLLSWLGQGDKGYNTNLAAINILILATGTLPGVGKWLEQKQKENLYRFWAYIAALVVFICAWLLRARSILLGMLIFVLVSLIPRKIWKHFNIYRSAIVALLILEICFPVILVTVWKREIIRNFVWMGKRLYSGREGVWTQFLSAFYKEPWTGIGSDIYRKIPNLEIAEVHNGFLHILVIYGILIFGITLFMIMQMYWQAGKDAVYMVMKRIDISFSIGLLAICMFENFIIMPVASWVWFLLMTRFCAGNRNLEE